MLKTVLLRGALFKKSGKRRPKMKKKYLEVKGKFSEAVYQAKSLTERIDLQM